MKISSHNMEISRSNVTTYCYTQEKVSCYYVKICRYNFKTSATNFSYNNMTLIHCSFRGVAATGSQNKTTQEKRSMGTLSKVNSDEF